MSTNNETWPLLERGGVRQSDLARTHPDQAEVRVPKYNGLVDPPGAEDLGRRLAEQARALAPTVVLLWEDPEDVVLGHIVARELGVPAARGYNADGLVGLVGSLPAAGRVLLLADAFRDPTAVRALRALVHQQGGEVAGTAVLLDTDALAAVVDEAGPVVSLASARARGGPVEVEAGRGNGTQ